MDESMARKLAEDPELNIFTKVMLGLRVTATELAAVGKDAEMLTTVVETVEPFLAQIRGFKPLSVHYGDNHERVPKTSSTKDIHLLKVYEFVVPPQNTGDGLWSNAATIDVFLTRDCRWVIIDRQPWYDGEQWQMDVYHSMVLEPHATIPSLLDYLQERLPKGAKYTRKTNRGSQEPRHPTESVALMLAQGVQAVFRASVNAKQTELTMERSWLLMTEKLLSMFAWPRIPRR